MRRAVRDAPKTAPAQPAAEVSLRDGFDGRPRIWRDPVHGDIEVERSEVGRLVAELIDSPELQRLRGIRQNGVMNFVFPGAEHSRFPHALGAHFIAGRMYDAIARNSTLATNSDERAETIIAALLHDVGHGPFSHTIEEVTKAIGVKFHHEVMTLRIISEDQSRICSALKKTDASLPTRLIPFIDNKKRLTPAWRYSLVSSQLDADRIDYLARDTMMSGVHHRFDHNRLISSLGIQNNQVVVSYRAADIVESYLLALDEMYAVAYYHKTVRAASILLTQAIKCAASLALDSKKTASRLFPSHGRPNPLWALLSKGENVDLGTYLQLDDHLVWSLISQWQYETDADLSTLARRLVARELPKTVDLAAEKIILTQDAVQHAQKAFRRQFPKLSADRFICIDEPTRLSYKRYTPGEGPGDSIRVRLSSGKLQALEERDRSIAKLVSTRAFFPRLVFPVEIRNEVESFLRNK